MRRMDDMRQEDDAKASSQRPKEYYCFLCLEDGRKLTMKNIKRHFETHNKEPIEEVNWCAVGQERTALHQRKSEFKRVPSV